MSSSRSRASAARQSSRGNAPSRHKTATRRKLETQAWAEASDARRGQVYRDDVVHTGVEMVPLPRKGTPEREALIEQLRLLRGQGASLTKCTEVTGFDTSSLGAVCRENGIVKGERGVG